MSTEKDRLAAVLEAHREQLWQLQNLALRLTVEGPLAEPRQRLAEGLAALAAALRAAAPALGATIEDLARALDASDVPPADVTRAFQTVEALCAALNGDEGSLSRLLDQPGTPVDDHAPEVATAADALSDRHEGVDPEDLRLFAAEAREHLERIETTLVELEASRDLKLISEIFRGAHSIKGAAQYLGLEATATLSHRAETLLERLRSQRLTLAPPLVSLLLRAFDALSTLVDGLDKGTPAPVGMAALVAELDRAILGNTAEAVATAAQGQAAPPAPSEPAPSAPDETAASQDDAELFASEYRENMRSARGLLENLQDLVSAQEKYTVASRNLHSLKGLAGLVGAVDLERLAGALDVTVGRLVRRREVPPAAQPEIDRALAVLEEVYQRHRRGEGGSPAIAETVAALEALAPREAPQAAVPDDPWQGLAEDAGTGPLAACFAALIEGLRHGNDQASGAALADLAKAARLQGCDEVAHAADALRGERRRLERSALRERLVALRNLLPRDLLSWRPPTAHAETRTFDDAVRGVPGIGPKKLRRLKEAGATSCEAVCGLGLPGLIAIPGISIEQAKMLLANCGGGASAATSGPRPAAETPTLEQQVLDDDYDRQLVGIYLDTTVRQIDAVRARLREGATAVASDLLGDLIGAARYMGYSALVSVFGEAREAMEAEAHDWEAASSLLATVRVRAERLRSQVSRLQEGTPAAPSDAEVKELERIFVESTTAHLASIRRDLELFLARPDETLLASLQHHLSCVHSAATNVGRDRMAVEAEGLQSRIEDLWLNPQAQGTDAAAAVAAGLTRLFEGCGLAAPALAMPAAPKAEPRTPPSPTATPDAAQPTPATLVTPREVPPATDPVPAAAPVTPSSDAGAPSDAREAGGSPAAPSATTAAAAADSDVSGIAEGSEATRALVDAQATVRVDTAKIDDLLNMVAELVVNRSAFMVLGTNLNELAGRLIDSGRLGVADARDLRTVLARYDEAMTEQGRVSNQLQQGVMLIRMMPVHTLFSKVPRVVRDLAMREGRRVRVVFSGEDTELDKTVIERLSDPLVHLIRNAISHGIESPEERLAAGKPAEGRLQISARHQGNIVIIEVEDDGRGIDFDKVRRRWVEAGLGSATQVSRLSTRELLSALFLPGFSTADKVTDVSGRGVGLDVVKRNIENLGGQVEAVTEPGRLSRFTIRIPLTMAIMQALLVRVASEIYAIPGSAVIEAERITHDQIYSVENQKVITLRRSVIPLVDLNEVFAYNYYLETGQSLGEPAAAAAHDPASGDDGGVYVVVLQGEGREIGIVVNGLIGSQDIVIKSLEDDLVDGRGIAGASILGDGTVALILDVGEICKMVTDGQHADDLRRSETMRQFERYLQERAQRGAEPSAPESYVH